MVERLFSIQEARGSIPRSSIFLMWLVLVFTYCEKGKRVRWFFFAFRHGALYAFAPIIFLQHLHLFIKEIISLLNIS